MKSSGKAKGKEVKLANQIGKVTAVIMVVVFSVLILAMVALTSVSVSEILDDSLFENADNTANRIENVFKTTESVADDINRYIIKSYETEEYGLSNMAGEIIAPEDSRTYKSMIYGTPITELNSDVEKYLIETARSAVLGDSSVIGAGVMFEPYCFDKNIESYAFYIDSSLGENDLPVPFGEYSDYSQEVYYKEARETKKPVFTEPYEFDGQMLISCAVPIIYDGVVQGVITADILSNNFADFVTVNEKYPSMYTTIYNSDLIDIFDSETASDVGRSMDEFFKNSDELQNVKEQIAKGEAFTATTTRENGTKIVRFFEPLDVGEEIWWAMTAMSQSDKYRQVIILIAIVVAIAIASLVIIVAVMIRLLRKKLKPIDQVVEAAEQIARGNLDAEIQVQSEDEIGRLGMSFRNTIMGLRRIIGDIDQLLGGMSDGNFAVKTKEEDAYVGEFNGILMSMRRLNTNLSETLVQIVEASDQVAIGSNQMAQSAQSLAEGATDQAGAVEELTATIENVSVTAVQNAEEANSAYQKSVGFEKEAEHSSSEMDRLNEAMKRITETSKQIEQIVGEIEDIASQTNLLSLNASIEAARAGEAGRGFAVVADQIGKLASDSAKSAVNTRELIAKALDEIRQGSEVTQNTAQSLESVIGGIQQLAATSKEISESSMAQAETMKQIQQGVEQISGVIQSNSATAEETSATSEELSAQADSLKSLVGKFQLKKQ